MKEFPQNLKFKHPWRSYQQKVLNMLRHHMRDGHLHVVAPPGSGKTVLGLEVAIRLNKPTLILAPTLTIRNQWIQRLCELFLETNIVPQWISTDIKKPTFLTVATYQGLHAACSGDESDEPEEIITEQGISLVKKTNEKTSNKNKPTFTSIVNGLKDLNIGTIVVDEAHHLKNEWWHTLIKVKDQLKPYVVGLTATPPYDVTYTEWSRYLELNGTIDTEISVPELIEAGDLCPHQDHIFFSMPTAEEFQKINKFRKDVHDLYGKLTYSETFVKILTGIAPWQDPENNLEWIYDNLFIYTSIIIYLHTNNIEIPPIHFQIMGFGEDVKIPEITYDRIEALLNFFLFQGKTFFSTFEEEQEMLRHQLQRHGVLEKNSINLQYSQRINKTLISSKSKMRSIKEIVNFEYDHLHSDLRMVILTDYIRSECLSEDGKAPDFNKIGVIPIFEYLQRDNNDNKRLGVLTGSITVIPASALSRFHELCVYYGLTDIEETAKPYNDNYLIIHSHASLKNNLVNIITCLFQEGEIEILVGTKSLLGEGWDAPAINSLILASFVGSFVLSNQMRGRAIRTQKGNPCKTSNIWHLVCVDPTVENGGTDFEVMTRRFRSFVGISNHEEPVIENGLQRLDVIRESYDRDEIEKINTETLAIAGNRDTLRERWQKGISQGVQLVEEIKIPFEREQKGTYQKESQFYLNRTIKFFTADFLLILAGFFSDTIVSVIQEIFDLNSRVEIWFFVLSIIISALVVCGKPTIKAFKLYTRYRDIAKDIKGIGEALLSSLIKQGAIKKNPFSLYVEAYSDKRGAVYCYLRGGSTFEQALFVNSLQEIVNVIENPRYIIVRKSRFLGSLEKRDYHAVPDILGKNKQNAKHFSELWKQHVGECELIYTRNIQGRRKLMEARVKSLSAQLTDENIAEQINKWR
ncbi:MAG: DEAD/DEAH box helicase family protein [Dysgonomonas sp.]|nr:DEAD/DEAH box helicase family protein [Dysgonomonas sp.]